MISLPEFSSKTNPFLRRNAAETSVLMIREIKNNDLNKNI